MRFETLHEALESVETRLVKNKIELEDDEKRKLFETYCFGGVSYGTQKSSRCRILRKRGRFTKQWCQLKIERLDSGIYEVVFYAL